MRTLWLTLPTADGPMDAYLARPDGAGPYPGVVLLQEAFGVNAHIRDVAERLARSGFVALAPELFHRTGTRVDIPYAEHARAMNALGALDNTMLATDVRAALAALRARPEVEGRKAGVLGFCMGGFAALLAGVRAQPDAVVSFYGAGAVRERPGVKLAPIVNELVNTKAPTLALFGGDDASIPPADVEAIKRALGRSPAMTEVVVYPGAKHAFHCDARPDAFHPAAAEQAWSHALGWLQQALSGVRSR